MKRKERDINRLKLRGLTAAKVAAVKVRHLDEHKHFVLAIVEGNAQRLDTLVSAMTKRGYSIFAVMAKISQAKEDLNHVKGYTVDEYKQQQQFLCLGGRAAAELAYRMQGLPSIRSTHEFMENSPRIRCSSAPAELHHNLDG